MKNYTILNDIINSFEPTPAIFNVIINRRINLKVKPIDRIRLFEDEFSTEAILYKLCNDFFTEGFNTEKLRYVVDRQQILNNVNRSIRNDLKSIFITVSPNVAPKMTNVYKTFNRHIYTDLPDKLNDILLSIWLYKHQVNLKKISNEKFKKNMYGLLCIVSEKIKDYKKYL